MIDLYPRLYATLKADSYFTETLSGFVDTAGRFKVFDGDDSPTTETPFISVELQPGTQSPLTNWQTPTVLFHVTGTDTDVSTLWAIANKVKDIFTDATAFSDGTVYQVVGEALFSQGTNPFTEHRTVSVALRFGLME